MSIDLSPIANSIMPFIQSVFGKVPLGIIVVGIPAALIIAFVLTAKLVKVVGAQFGLGGPKITSGGSSMKLVSSGKARVGRSDSLGSRPTVKEAPTDVFSYAEERRSNAHKEQSPDSFLESDAKLAHEQDALDKSLDRAIKKNNSRDQDVETFKVRADRLAEAKRRNKPIY